MLAGLIRLCVTRRFVAVVVTLAVAAYGVFAYLQTPIEAYPDVTNVQVNVIAVMPGLAPEEIERQVTIPLERVLNGTPGVELLRSESLFGLSLIWLVFEDGADSFRARILVNERLASAELPEGISPELAPDYTPLGKVYYYRLVSDRHSLEELRAEQEWTVSRVMRQVHGVGDVVGIGGFLKEFHVEVDPARLVAYDLTLTEVTEALEASNLNVGGGFLRHGEQELVIRGIGYMATPEDVKHVVLRSEEGTPIIVGDVARVIHSHTPRRGTVGYDLDNEAVMGIVLLRRGENPSVVLEGIHQQVRELNERILPEGMRIETIYDRSELVGKTLQTVHHNLLHGALLIVGVVWLFLRSVRGSLIVATIIPLSLLTAFIGLYKLGLSANLISMGAIDFGIIVDGAVILVENVIHQARVSRPKSRKEIRSMVARAALDVARPTFFAMAIIIAALLPVFTLESVEGRIFRPLALTYTFALAGALIFALTFVPALCALILRPKDAEVREPASINRLRDAYGWTLSLILRHRFVVIVLALAVLAAAAWRGTKLGTEFLPELDEGDLYIFVEMPPSISLEKGQEMLLEVRRRLLEYPEVVATVAEQGRPEDGTDNESVSMAKVFAILKPPAEWRDGWTKDRLTDDMRRSLDEVPGVRASFSQPIKDTVEESVAGVRGQLVLKIFGTDLDAMRRSLVEAIGVLRDVPGVVDLDLYRDAVVPQLQIELDRAALAREGITIGTAQDVIETSLAGKVVTTLWEGERLVPVRVRLPLSERSEPDRIAEIMIPTAFGANVPLRDLADIQLSMGRTFIPREANSRYLALGFNVEGRDLGSVVRDAMQAVEAGVTPPDGHFFVWAGEFENQQRAMARLQVIVPITLVIVLGLLYSALNSAQSVIAILLAVPFALTGGVFALLVADIPLSVSAAIGFIALLGQVSLMGLLALSAIDGRRREGDELRTAILTGAGIRFRAILMASLLAALGLVPMAISTGVGSEIQRPFAVVIVGGMMSTLLVALFLLPVLYSLVARRPVPVVTDDDDDLDHAPQPAGH